MRRLNLGSAGFLFGATVAVAQPPGRGNQGTRIEPGQSCPPGMTEVRPRNCQAPGLPPPSILDYRPRSTLVAPTHPVPKAKYPAIDFHGMRAPAESSERCCRHSRASSSRHACRTC